MVGIQGYSDVLRGAIIALLAVATSAGLLFARRRVRGTTLVAPWCWAIAAFTAVSGIELAAAFAAETPAWLPAARFLAAAVTFCPTMAVLGAKRPQDRAWQWIVLTLLVVVALPGIESLLRHGGTTVMLHAARKAFVAILIGVGVLNYLPTRRAPAALLFGAAQVALLAGPLELALPLTDAARVPAALALVLFACLAAFVPLPRHAPRRESRAPVDRMWLDFRDAYGGLWALRVKERLRAGLAPDDARWLSYGWGRLVEPDASTDGATASHSPPSDASSAAIPATLPKEIETTLVSLLSRFVSPEWIDARRATG